MPRPPLPIGSHGTIGTQKDSDGTWRAFARFRFFDGQTRQIERSGSTKRQAIKRLKDRIKELQGSKARLTVDSKFRDVADLWLAKVAKRRAATTHNTYRLTLKNVVLDRIGDLRLREVDVPAPRRFLRGA
ncbi:hypothetical protein MOQ72_25085 [Saccharopolyspora sp. K220]|uniref:hypothetical protein n=1 Tax=Saccharopolyspora soli TaxID=2926618 RepID=UPI001F576367|nr:hypothetical protein [Saccharopolyspora soli]MCI2420727.1 hypothetical protein [Saccharopolyspora soli]